MSHTRVGTFTNGAPPALNAGNLNILDSQYDDAMADVAAGYVAKGVMNFNVRDYGAKVDSTTDDTAAVDATIAAAAAVHGRVVIPVGPFGTVCMTKGHTITGVNGISFDMQGTLKRIGSGPATSLLYFLNCSNVWAGTIRTDGNISGNGGTFTNGQQDVTLDGCTDVTIGQILSTNPACDSLYIRGAGGRIRVGVVSSVSAGFTGRNAVSIIKGDGIWIGHIYGVNTGYSTQPGGLDIEPNGSTDLVNDVHIGSMTYTGTGTQGFSIYSQAAYGQVITNVFVGHVNLHKLTGTASTANDILISGCQHVKVTHIQHLNDTATNQCVQIDNCDDVTATMDVKGGLKGINFGPGSAVTNLDLHGSVQNTASHALYVYSLNDSKIDMKVKNPANGFLVLVKSATGTSSNVRFSGDWSKASTGSQVISGSGLTTGITNWVLDGVDLTGWALSTLFQNGSVLQNVQKLNCRGVNFRTAAPTGTDQWALGDEVRNSAPAVGSPKAWVCTVAGAPGTWVSTGNL